MYLKSFVCQVRFGSLPRQRLPNLVGLSPRWLERKPASRQRRSNIRLSLTRHDLCDDKFRGLKQPTAKFGDRYAIKAGFSKT